jgi:hypothetical protein
MTPAVRSSVYGVFTAVRVDDVAQNPSRAKPRGQEGRFDRCRNTRLQRRLQRLGNRLPNHLEPDIGLEVFRDEIDPKIDKNLWHTNFGGGAASLPASTGPTISGSGAPSSASSVTSIRDRLIRGRYI